MRARTGTPSQIIHALDIWRIRAAQTLFPHGSSFPDPVNRILREILTDVLTGDTTDPFPESTAFSRSTVLQVRKDLEQTIAMFPEMPDAGVVYEAALARPVEFRDDGQAGLQQGTRRTRGAYYTPQAVIDYILAAAFQAVTDAGIPGYETAVCDPACGCGYFLRAAQVLCTTTASSGDRHSAEGSSKIYGLDLDPLAARIARWNTGYHPGDGGHPAPIPHIATGDALIGEECVPAVRGITRPFSWQKAFPDVFKGGGFAIICGNPPWGSQGLRGAGRFPVPIEQYLREHYPRSAEYKLNTASLFIDRSLSLLRNGGVCGFIVPDSLLIGKYAARLRSLILDTCRIRQIVLIGRDFWQGATPGRSAILILQKEADIRQRESNPVTAAFAPTLDALTRGPLLRFTYPQSYFGTVPYHRFRLFFSPESMKFVQKMEAGTIPLHTLATVHTGVRSRIGKKGIVSPWWNGPGWFPAITSGSEVTPYALSPRGSYIHIQPDLLWGGGWDPNVVLREKLILRQTGDHLIACLDRQGHYHLNNCHSMVPARNIVPPAVLLALLNSSALNCYYQLISLERGRPLAQVDIDQVLELPICIPPPDMMQEIGSRVERILFCAAKIQASGEGADATPWREEQHARDADLQNLVNRAYGVSGEETRMAERFWNGSAQAYRKMEPPHIF